MELLRKLKDKSPWAYTHILPHICFTLKSITYDFTQARQARQGTSSVHEKQSQHHALHNKQAKITSIKHLERGELHSFKNIQKCEEGYDLE